MCILENAVNFIIACIMIIAILFLLVRNTESIIYNLYLVFRKDEKKVND